MTTVGARVVVGVDRSAEGVAAMQLALGEASLRGLPLVCVRVWPEVVHTGFPQAGLLPFSVMEAEQEARRVVEEMVKQSREQVPAADGVDVDILALRGAAGPALVEAAHDASLLVVGTRCAGPVSRALLGSVSRYALHHSACPVAVVPAVSGQGPEPARVLVGVDHSPASLAALAWAAGTALRRGAVLVPVLVRDPSWAEDDESLALSDLEAGERRFLHQAVPAAPGLRVEPEVVTGSPGRALERLARPQDLLVVGSRGRSAAASALLGSTSTHAVRHAPCPVVVVRAA